MLVLHVNTSKLVILMEDDAETQLSCSQSSVGISPTRRHLTKGSATLAHQRRRLTSRQCRSLSPNRSGHCLNLKGLWLHLVELVVVAVVVAVIVLAQSVVALAEGDANRC